MTTVNSTLERDVADLRSKITAHRSAGDEKRKAAKQLVEDEKKAGRNPLLGLTDDDRDSFARIDAAYKEADTEFEAAVEYERRLHTMLDAAGHEARDHSGGDPGHPDERRVRRAFRTVGALFIASPVYRALVESGRLDSDTARVETDPVQVLTRDGAMAWLARQPYLADVGDGDDLIPEDQRLIPPEPIPVRRVRLFDMVNVGSTNSDLVRYTEQTTRDSAAAPTPFGTASPKSRYVWTKRSAEVKRITHHVVADKGNLADQAQLRTLIDGDLMEDLRIEAEYQALQGNGGDGWVGVYNWPGIGEHAVGADTIADALHKAITTVRLRLEQEPSAWGIHPIHFEEFTLEKDDFGRYLHNRGPNDADVPSIWGLPAMIGTQFVRPLVGNFRRGITVWQRTGVSVAASDGVDQFFLEGLVAVLAEMRGAMAVRQPRALCEVTGLSESS